MPEGGGEVKIGDETYVKVGDTYYQPVKVDGKDKYEVAQIEEGDKSFRMPDEECTNSVQRDQRKEHNLFIMPN